MVEIIAGGIVGIFACTLVCLVVAPSVVRYWLRRSDSKAVAIERDSDTKVTIEPPCDADSEMESDLEMELRKSSCERAQKSLRKVSWEDIKDILDEPLHRHEVLVESKDARSEEDILVRELARKEVSWQDVRAGLCAFDPPPKMKVGRSEIIAVRVSPQDPDDFVAMAKMVATLYRSDEAKIEPIEVGRLMRARLQGEPDAFDITALSSEDQLLELNKIARWDFSVRPKRSGERWLQLVISVRVPEDGRVELRDLEALRRTIKVEVAPLETLKQFAAKRGEFIADKALIPLILFFLSALGVTAWFTGLLGGSQPTSVSPPAVPANVATQEAPAQSSLQKSPEQ
jgi:hypothetical protein